MAQTQMCNGYDQSDNQAWEQKDKATMVGVPDFRWLWDHPYESIDLIFAALDT